MIICLYDTCISNVDGCCIRTDIVLAIVNEEETLTCKNYREGNGVNE